jgi:hypothetical protein
VQKRQPLSDGTQKVVAVRQVTNDLGEVVEEQVVDSRFLQLDPAQAENVYRQQKRNERLRRAGQIGLGALSIFPAVRAARMVGTGITSLGKKIFTQPVTRKGGLGEIFETGRRFTTAPFLKQFPKTSNVIKFGAPPAVPAAIFTAGSVGDPLQEQITALEENRSDESIAGDDEVIETDTTENITKVSASDDDNLVKTVDDAVGANGTEDDNTIETTNLFGSERFLDFIRNVGTSLATSENLGKGLVQGAAAAAQERAVKDALKQEQFADILKAQIEAGRIKVSDREAVRKVDIELGQNITDYETTYSSIRGIDQAIKAIENEGRPGTAAGLQGLFGKVYTQIMTLIGDNEGTNFDDLDARTKGEAILKVLSQQNIRASLQEAGRAISNLDRQVAAEVFGEITTTTPLAVILKKLRDTKERFANDQVKTRNALISNTSFLQDAGINSKTLESNQQKIEAIITDTYGVNPNQVQDNTDAIDIPLDPKEKTANEFAASR